MLERKRRSRRLYAETGVTACVALAGVLTGVGGCDTRGTSTDKPAPANIILIVIDTLRADH
ncbi:MAG: hypothetical protein KKI02_09790, partial [Planctomycetes bacterium]|nr:hypothetical protein [Planctomycetota bacterium]